MAEENIERRKGFEAFQDKLIELEKDVAVIKSVVSKMEGRARILWGNLAGLLAVGATMLIGYGQLTSQIQAINATDFQAAVAVHLALIKGQEESLGRIKEEQSRLRGIQDDIHVDMNDLRKDLTAKMSERTNDRFYGKDWKNAEKWIAAEMGKLQLQINQINDREKDKKL